MPQLTSPPLAPHELQHVNLQAFAADLEALKQRALAELGEQDYRHLRKMERWGRLCTLAGYGTAWIFPNPLSALLISQGNLTRWALFNHHIGHRGYDRIKNIPARYHSKTFAKGWRRWIDWPDWITPAAWNFEHNVLHHYHTGETLDPDLLERNVELMRRIKAPLWLKYLITFFFMCTWKLSYYAPNTLWMEQQVRRRKQQGTKGAVRLDQMMEAEPTATYHGTKLLLPFSRNGLDFWARCVLPYATYRFVLLPALFLPLGAPVALSVLLTSVMAEVFTNIHSFLIIVPNHSGEDLYRFDGPIQNKDEFYFRQVIGSVNYSGGSDLKDFLQGWLNYQIEHHLWPDLPMHTYRKLQPQVEAVCQKHGVPYVSESLWQRVRKMLRLMVGQASMQRLPADLPRILNTN